VPPESPLLTITDVARQFGVSDRQIRRLVRAKLFPAPVMIMGSPRWHQQDVDAVIWLTTRGMFDGNPGPADVPDEPEEPLTGEE
jgi:predicted DNA-binding transcriptional regulator AlpA